MTEQADDTPRMIARPAGPLPDRMRMLGALAAVDWVVAAPGDGACLLDDVPAPDVLAVASTQAACPTPLEDRVIAAGGCIRRLAGDGSPGRWLPAAARG